MKNHEISWITVNFLMTLTNRKDFLLLTENRSQCVASLEKQIRLNYYFIPYDAHNYQLITTTRTATQNAEKKCSRTIKKKQKKVSKCKHLPMPFQKQKKTSKIVYYSIGFSVIATLDRCCSFVNSSTLMPSLNYIFI